MTPTKFFHITFEGAPVGGPAIFGPHQMRLWARDEADAVFKLYEFYAVHEVHSVEQDDGAVKIPEERRYRVCFEGRPVNGLSMYRLRTVGVLAQDEAHAMLKLKYFYVVVEVHSIEQEN